MKTEIQGDFKGYFLRCKFPSKKCFTMPLKSAGIVLLTELILSGLFILIGIPTWSVVISLMLCLLAVGYYIGVLYKDFWNIVLEKAEGFLPDMVMWIYYMALFVISLFPAFVVFYLSGM